MTLFIEAFNIDTGGAKILLNLLVKKITELHVPLTISVKNEELIDKHIILAQNMQFKIRKNSIHGILSLLKPQNHSIYFGNLPPFFRSSNSLLYVHSPYLILSVYEILKLKVTLSNKLKLLLQITIITLFHKNVTYLAVQTHNMADKLSKMLKRNILILPFFEEKQHIDDSFQKVFDFCYVGLPSKHKNHEKLLEVVKTMIQKKTSFSLALTVPFYKENNHLLSEIETINSISTGCIHNFGMVDSGIIHEIYSKSRAMIFPSKKETLGLPIIEALQHKLIVLSSDMEFSYDIIENPITFDPDDIIQIEKVMKDFLEGKFNFVKQSLKIKSQITKILELISS